MTITERIFYLIKENGMTQKDFATASGIAPSTISDWKRKNYTPSADKIIDICRVLGVTSEQLLTGKGIDEAVAEAETDEIISKKDLEIIKEIHSLKKEQAQRLMAYLKTLQQLERLEDI